MGRGGEEPTVLVTAGPTREHIDPIRFLTNASTGRMGFAVAREAAGRGLRTVLITGPVALEDPPDVEVVRVVSAEEMAAAVLRAHREAGIVVATAAVADFRPARGLDRKLAKEEGLAVEWVRTPDILAEIAARKGGRVHVGFALETGPIEDGARGKLRRKALDFIVANGPENLGAARGSFLILDAAGGAEMFGDATKEEVAARILDRALALWRGRRRSGSGPEGQHEGEEKR